MTAGFSPHWALAFGLLGNIVSFMVLLSPIPTFYEIYKKKTSEGFQSVPYVVALFSCMLWIFYAFLKSNTTLIITINSVGLLIETIYICFYLFYAPKKSRVQTLKVLVLLIVCGFGCIVLSTLYLVKPPSQRAVVVGWICLVFSLCVFIAPLCILRRVIQTKSVEYMPFLLSFFLTLSAVMWFFYGLLIKDFVVAVPNVLGFSFGVIQMLLYLKYKNGGKNIISNNDQKQLPADIQKQQVMQEDQINIEIVKLSEQVLQTDKIAVASSSDHQMDVAISISKNHTLGQVM